MQVYLDNGNTSDCECCYPNWASSTPDHTALLPYLNSSSMPGPWSLNVRPSLIDCVWASVPLTELHVIRLGCGPVKGLLAQYIVMQLNTLSCHDILCPPMAPQSSAETQGTYTFWGARLFSYLNISVPDDTWIFQVGQNVCHALCCVKSIPLTLTCGYRCKSAVLPACGWTTPW